MKSTIKKVKFTKTLIKKYAYAFTVIIGLVIIGFVYVPKQKRLVRLLEKEGVYVIGTVIDIKGMKGGQKVTFIFKFEDKLWKDEDFKVIGKQNIGKKFLVKILPMSPNINEILPEYLIKDTIIYQPPEGWKKIPVDLISDYTIKQ